MSQNSMTRHFTTASREEFTTSRHAAMRIGERLHRIMFSTAPAATLLLRTVVGAVFLLEGILKFLNPQELGVGRFMKIGIPFASFFAPFDGVFEIGCGILLMLGLMTRLGAIPMIINMIVAITSTKIPMLFQEGFWKGAHEARLDFSMLLGCIFLLLVGAGPLSLDHIFLRRHRMLKKTVGAVALAGLLILAGGTTSQVWAQTATEKATAPSTANAEPSSVKQTVEVRLTEYRIEMPVQLRAGRTLFKVTNAGRMFHSLEIEGSRIEKEIESGVDAGHTSTLELDLKPGAYEVYCPVHGHKKAGMSLRVQVT